MLSFPLFKRFLSYTSLIVLASLGCTQESFAMDMRKMSKHSTRPSRNPNTVVYLNFLNLELAEVKKEESRILKKFNKIINNSHPKSLRLPPEILNNYLKILSEVFRINENDLSGRFSGLLWKPIDLLSSEERITKASNALDEWKKTLNQPTPEKQSESLQTVDPTWTSYSQFDYAQDPQDNFSFSFMSELSAGHSGQSQRDDFSFDFMTHDDSPEYRFTPESNRKEGLSDFVKRKIIDSIAFTKYILGQETSIEDALQGLITRLKKEYPSLVSYSIDNPEPLTYFQNHTFPAFLSLCDAINISAYCSLELKEESKYESVENNLNLLIKHLNFNDKKAQDTRAQALFLKAELYRLKTDHLREKLAKNYSSKKASLDSKLSTAYSSRKKALKTALLNYIEFKKKCNPEEAASEAGLAKASHSNLDKIDDLKAKLLNLEKEYSLELEGAKLNEGYEAADKLYDEVRKSSPPEFLFSQSLFWSTEMRRQALFWPTEVRRCAQVPGVYLDSHMQALADERSYPFVIKSKAHLRSAPAESLLNYKLWKAQPLTPAINYFELKLYEKTLDKFLLRNNPFGPIQEQDTWGEIFLLKLENIYHQIPIKLSDYLPDATAQQKYERKLLSLAAKIHQLYLVRNRYITHSEEFNPDIVPFPRTAGFFHNPINLYDEETKETFFEDLRDNYRFLKDRRFKRLSLASQLKILTRLNTQADKEKFFANRRDIYKQQSGEAKFQTKKEEDYKKYFQGLEGKIKNAIYKENCQKIIREINEKLTTLGNEAAVILLDTAQQELKTKESGFDNFMQTLSTNLQRVLAKELLPEEVNPRDKYQKIKDDHMKGSAEISRLFSAYKDRLSSLLYNAFAEDQIADLLEIFKSELRGLTSIKNLPSFFTIFPQIQRNPSVQEELWFEQKAKALEQKAKAVLALTQMDQSGQGRERPSGNYTTIDVKREEKIFQVFEELIGKAPFETLKSKARFGQLEMLRMGQIEDAGLNFEKEYKMLLQNECSEKLKTQIKASLAELRYADCVSLTKIEGRCDEEKLYKAYKTFYSIIYTPSLSKEIRFQGDA